MTEKRKAADRGGLAIGGTTLMGLGVGFIFLRASVLAFIASILIGVGLGLLIASLLPGNRA